MSPVLVTLLCFAGYALGYFVYAKHLARRCFDLDPDAPTPAHALEDGYDYVPSNRYVLFGHHYASIAGLSPMLGPAIAVIWGWLPALLWVVLGTIFIGAVHDFSALVVSMRAKGMSIGKVAEDLIGRRAMTLFHLIIFFLICLGMGVFVHVVAKLFSIETVQGVRTATSHPEAVFPTFTLMVLAILSGLLIYKTRVGLFPVTVVSFALVLAAIFIGLRLPEPHLSGNAWKWILLGYCFIASSLPVWLLLQPRDYINSFLLYLGLGAAYLGLFVLNPEFAAPAHHDAENSPSLFPFVFIVIACGAISGFHGLVSSGTTAKQINKETDACFIGYGGMIGESLLGLLAVLACTAVAGFASSGAWEEAYASWDVAYALEAKIGNFILGSASFVSSLGVPMGVAKAFMSVIVVSFALTSLDSATRLLRFNLAEMAGTIHLPFLKRPVIGSAVAVGAIGFFAFIAGMPLWALFGSTNQLLGGLTLLAVTVYLMGRKRPTLYTAIPMVFMLVTTITAILGDTHRRLLLEEKTWETYLLLGVGSFILVLALWLCLEALIQIIRMWRRGKGGSPSGAGLSGVPPGDDSGGG